MTTQDSRSREYERLPRRTPSEDGNGTLWQLTAYFLKLGTIGFGGPVALVGYMHRDLVERHRWIDDEEYKLGLALAQIMPGRWPRSSPSPSATSRTASSAPPSSGWPSSCRRS